MPKRYLYVILLITISCEPNSRQDLNILFDLKSSNYPISLLDSSSINIDSIISTQNSILLFFSPDCPYSKAQINIILENKQILRDFKIIAVTNYPYAVTKAFYIEHKIDIFPNLVMGVDRHDSFINYFNITSVPFLAFINKEKKLIKTSEGVMSSDEIETVTESK